MGSDSLTESSELSQSADSDGLHTYQAQSRQQAGQEPVLQAKRPSNGQPHAPAGTRSDSDVLQQRYLNLLNTGRLASKKKHEREAGHTAHLLKSTRPDADDDKQKSVYEADIARMRTTAAALDVEPIQQYTILLGSTSSSPHRRCSSARGAPSEPTTLSCSMYQKLYKPGPADYSPQVDRKGGWDGVSVTFGTARQRPPNACVQETSVSPGPVYMPSKSLCSSMSSPPRFRFGKGSMNSRTDLNADSPSNHYHWNPGPGRYDPAVLTKGDSLEPGMAAPRTVFGTGPKLMTPQLNLSATTFVSAVHSEKENKGVHSPGPARYSPDLRPISTCAAHFTLGAKQAGYFDAFLDPLRQSSPGPVYHTGSLDRKGGKTWAVGPRPTFGKAGKSWSPELNLSATTFITSQHAHVNQGIHSPGPVYAPDIKPHVSSMPISSGPKDRFYDRFELGRL